MRKREAYEVEFKARAILGLKEKTEGAMSGVGGILAKAVFGFNSENGRIAPDAWFLPEDRHNPAIIMTCMAPEFDITIPDCYSEKLLRTCLNTFTMPGNYDKMIGILYNGEVARVFKCKQGIIEEIPNEAELHNKDYYLSMWEETANEGA